MSVFFGPTTATNVLFNWNQLILFLDDCVPSLSKNIVGATQKDIDVLRQHSLIDLPKNYLGFLRHFGGEDGGVRVFPRHLYLATELAQKSFADTAAWDRSQYWLIGLMDYRLVEDPHDLFLALSLGDSIDAPVVGMDPDPDDTSSDSFPIAHSLADLIVSGLAWRLAKRNKKFEERVVAFCGDSGNKDKFVRQRFWELVCLMKKSGFSQCVSGTENTWMGIQYPETLVLIRVSLDKDLVAVNLIGDNPALISKTCEMVVAAGLAEPMSLLR